MLIEVIVQTVADARAAWHGGADRLEVVRDIQDGGLTPSFDLIRAIQAETSLPLRIMVRENAGYATSPDEIPALRRAAMACAAAGADGIVIGFAERGELALDDVLRVVDAAPDLPVTFHRAFDQLADPLAAIDRLAQVSRIDRILTDGGGGDPVSRCERLRGYVTRAGARLKVLAGGGVTEEAFELFARTRCVAEVHVGRIAREGNDWDSPVSAARVRRLRHIAG